jgi:DNA-binding LytR/AlgR family response regulator
MSTSKIINRISEELGLLLSTSFGIFIFVLFFQPFTLNHFEFNNLLVFVAGLAAIVFLALVITRTVIPLILMNYGDVEEDNNVPAFLSGFIILVLTSLAFIFYLRYVGGVSMSFYNVIKVILICLIPVVSARLYDLISELKQQNRILIQEKQTIQNQFEKLEEDYLNKTIEFVSEYGSETISLVIADILLVKSADNYVEIIFKESGKPQKKLIRNTLKNVENQLRPYSNFLRCHRTCIVNTLHIEKFNKKYTSQWIKMQDYDEQIPVSRQYLLKLKEAL